MASCASSKEFRTNGHTVLLTLVVGLGGCTGMSQTEQSTLSGGAVDAAGRALIGAMGGNAGMGAAIGGEVGLTGG